jgi:hypothetical protein
MTSRPGRQGWVEKPEATGPVDHGWTTGERARTVGMKSLPKNKHTFLRTFRLTLTDGWC